MLMTQSQHCPPHLREPGRKLWQAVQSERLLSAEQLVLLEVAATARDREAAAREQIEREGQVLRGGRYGPRPHPLLATERDARLATLRALRMLRHVPDAATGEQLAAELGYDGSPDDDFFGYLIPGGSDEPARSTAVPRGGLSGARSAVAPHPSNRRFQR
jgi:hypothetical protein